MPTNRIIKLAHIKSNFFSHSKFVAVAIALKLLILLKYWNSESVLYSS